MVKTTQFVASMCHKQYILHRKGNKFPKVMFLGGGFLFQPTVLPPNKIKTTKIKDICESATDRHLYAN